MPDDNLSSHHDAPTAADDIGAKLTTVQPQIAKSLAEIAAALTSAGIKLPEQGLHIELPIASNGTPDTAAAKCIQVCIAIFSDDGRFLGWFCYFDCTGRVRDPRNVKVTCSYGGQTYSEGALINAGGKTQKCSPNPHEAGAGMWVTVD